MLFTIRRLRLSKFIVRPGALAASLILIFSTGLCCFLLSMSAVDTVTNRVTFQEEDVDHEERAVKFPRREVVQKEDVMKDIVQTKNFNPDLGRRTAGTSFLEDIIEDEDVVDIQEDAASASTSSSDFFSYLKGEIRRSDFPGVEGYTSYTIQRLHLKTRAAQGLQPDFGPVINDVTSFRYPISVNTCSSPTVGNRSLFVAVISAPEYFEKRQTIRETWARHLRHQSDVGVELVGIAFVIGQVPVRSLQKKLEEEGDRHGDILQVSMLDSYYNITLKVAGLLNWLHNNCRTVDFVLKVDDDVYVNVRNLATTLAALPPFYKSMYGSQMPKQGLEPARTKEDKWSMSYESWPWLFYPRFLRGASVLMAGNTITSLLAAFQTIPFIPFDDVYLSGLAAMKANVTIMTNKWFFEMYPKFPVGPCFIFDTIAWLTKSSAELKSSHANVELFYGGIKKCLFTDKLGDKAAIAAIFKYRSNSVNPGHIMDFEFKPVSQKDEIKPKSPDHEYHFTME